MRLIATLALLSALFLPSASVAQQGSLVPDLGPDISGHEWARYTAPSDDVFETVVAVFYAVPETDDVVISGQCFIGAQGPLVRLQVGADIEGMQEGAPATLQVRADDGRLAEVPGSVVGTDAEVGISGVEVVLQVSDPAWLVMTATPTVQFMRQGGPRWLHPDRERRGGHRALPCRLRRDRNADAGKRPAARGAGGGTGRISFLRHLRSACLDP